MVIATSIPKAKGNKTSKLKFDILPIIKGYVPTDSKNALPDIPGKSRKEHAKNPKINNRYELGSDSPSIPKELIKCPIKIAKHIFK